MKRGTEVPEGTTGATSLADAADDLNVGRTSVARVRLVREMSGDEVLDAVEPERARRVLLDVRTS